MSPDRVSVDTETQEDQAKEYMSSLKTTSMMKDSVIKEEKEDKRKYIDWRWKWAKSSPKKQG